MFENLLSEGGISLDRLKNFCLVAENGGIARACDGDPSRQALMSRQISELETFFGTELTRRKGKGIELTHAGHELARQARIQFQGLSDFKAACAGKPIEFRIASGNSVIEWLLAPCMADVASTVPGSTFALLDWRTGDVVRGLLDHTVDFGIVRKSAIVQPLKFHPLGKFGYSLFVPRALARKGRAIPATLPLAVAVGGEFLQHFTEATRNARIAPSIVYRCTSFTQAAQLARSGVAAAVLPEIAAPFLTGFASPCPVPWMKSFHRDLGLSWHRRVMDIRPRAERVRDALRLALETVTGTLKVER